MAAFVDRGLASLCGHSPSLFFHYKASSAVCLFVCLLVFAPKKVIATVTAFDTSHYRYQKVDTTLTFLHSVAKPFFKSQP